MEPFSLKTMTLRGSSLVWFVRAHDEGMERVSVIDRRGATTDYKVCDPTPYGIHVVREGFIPKLILWHQIEDLNFTGIPPGATAPSVGGNGAGGASGGVIAGNVGAGAGAGASSASAAQLPLPQRAPVPAPAPPKKA